LKTPLAIHWVFPVVRREFIVPDVKKSLDPVSCPGCCPCSGGIDWGCCCVWVGCCAGGYCCADACKVFGIIITRIIDKNSSPAIKNVISLSFITLNIMVIT
jgi:hypothetical protein